MLAAVLLLVWIASFFVPAGAYKTDARRRTRARHLPQAAVVLRSGGDGTGHRRRVAGRERAGAGRRRGRPRRDRYAEAGLPASTRRSASASSSSGTPRRTASTASRARNGFVGPWEEGFLYGSAAIFLFVLAVGAFITVTMKSEAIQTGIGRLALRFRTAARS